jgi:signal transduction histidine kinase
MGTAAATLGRRLTLTLAALLLAFAALVAVLVRQVATAHEQEALQRLSHGLAAHIVGHWPEITVGHPGQAAQAERDALLQMLMVVNPGIQVYVLDAEGRVQAYLGEPGMVRQAQVDLAPVRSFLGGGMLPIRGTDPMGSNEPHIFSAARFRSVPGDAAPPGYLYIVLDGAARAQVAGSVSLHRVWRGTALVAALGLLATLAAGALLMRRLTRPLLQLAGRMQAYAPTADAGTMPAPADEVQAIAQAWAGMVQRVEQQAAREAQQVSAHREMMAGVAHDLRTPLTALHGHLEALAGERDAPDRQRLLGTALAQSDKVRRLSQQLFELASLQSTDQVLHRERFSLDELVSDAVQKFGTDPNTMPVVLDGAQPGRLELDGDLQLIERAVTNLIDNALRHAAGPAPVRVQLQRAGSQAHVVVQDAGPGLSAELLQRLLQGQSLREPPLRRPGGGIGGLGLAIAQRVAQLHGGSLQPLATPDGGTRLCLALPLAGPA